MMTTRKTRGGTCKIRLDGELTIYQAAEFKLKMAEQVDKCKSLVVDLSEVGELDTACFQVLIQAKRECLAAGKEMQLVSHSPAVLDVIESYGMAEFFGDPVLLPAGREGTGGAGA